MDEARAVERAAQRADAAVHHVRRRDDVDARRRVAQRLAGERLDGFVVHHVARRVDQAVLAMAGVRVERDVGDDAQRRKVRLQRAHGARHQARVVPRVRGIVGFLIRRNNGKERDRRYSGATQRSASCSSKSIDLRATPGSDGDGHLPVSPSMDEHRIDEVVGGELRLARETPREIVAPHPAHSLGGKRPVKSKPMLVDPFYWIMELAKSSTVTFVGR